MFECCDAKTAQVIAEHKLTKKYCLAAGDKHLVVKAKDDTSFQAAVHKLGFGMLK